MKRYTAHNIQQRLDSIWRRGDKDECSTKHVFYGLASILKGKRWFELGDYPLACMHEVSQDVIQYKWERLEEISREVGLVKFKELVAGTNFEMSLIESYMERGELC